MNTLRNNASRSIATLALAFAPATLSFSDQGDYQTGPNPSDHAAIGVMGEHLHNQGEYMLSYRRMSMSMDGHRVGEERIAPHQVFQRGFSVAATSMDMNMDMFGFMYAPTNDITLMLMANHLDMEMDMMANPHAHMMGGHGGHGHGQGMMSHSTSGWGDTSLTALIRAFESESIASHWNIGLSAPTGSVTERMHGSFQPYGMQLGSGTWDARIGGTITTKGERLRFGGQALGTFRLEDTGESGFGRSDVFEGSVWALWRQSGPLSISSRLKYTAEGPLKGHYNGPHSHAAPPHFQANYGGDILEALIGLNFVFRDGPLTGNRLALEYGKPLYQQLNGVGMNRDDSITLGWQLAF